MTLKRTIKLLKEYLRMNNIIELTEHTIEPLKLPSIEERTREKSMTLENNYIRL